MTRLVSILLLLLPSLASAQSNLGLAGSGNLLIGDTTSATPVAITTNESANGASKRSTIQVGRGWQILQDNAANGTRNLAIYGAGQTPVIWDTAGRTNLTWLWNTASRTNAFAKAGWSLFSNTQAGTIGTATGTVTTRNTEGDIGNIAATTDGSLSEFATDYEISLAYRNAVQKDWNIWGRDQIVVDNPANGTSGSQAPQWFVGTSIRIHPQNDMRVLSATNAGSVGLSLVNRPLLAGEFGEHGDRSGDTTQPALAMLSIAGFSGHNCNSSGANCPTTGGQTGTYASGDAAAFAVRIGGGGGSVYIPYTARSQFQTGMLISDWRLNGIRLAAPIAGYTSFPFVTEANAGNSGFGITTPVDTLQVAHDLNLTAADPAANGNAQLLISGVSNPLQRMAFAYDTTNNVGMIQAETTGTSTSPLALNPKGGAVSANGVPLPAFGTPASSLAACVQGQIEFDAAYLYTCVATNTWRRVASSSF